MPRRRDEHSPAGQLALLAIATLVAGLAFNLLEYGRLMSLTLAQEIASTRGVVYGAVYLGTYAVAAAAIVVAVFSRSAIVRWVSLAAVFAFLGLEFCTRLVIGGNIGFNEVHTTLSESTFAGQFVWSYLTSVWQAALLAGAITAGLIPVVHWTRIRFAVWWLCLAPVAASMMYAVMWRTVAATDVYPSPLRVPVLFAYASLNSLDARPRQPVEMPVEGRPQPRVLILVMDESVTGAYLSINGWRQQTTPYLESSADQYLNFGISCSASNISAATNVIIRAGLRVDQIADRAQLGLRKPTIFQYAQAAGYRTAYLDGQYAPGVRGNFLTRYDLDSIDEVYWVIADEPDSAMRYRRDRLLAQRVLELVEGGEPVFIWVSKYGAHVHYEQAYPAEARVFEPTMPAGRSMAASTAEEVENSYANALRWAVDGFWEMLAPALDLDDTVVLYTSDHGQSIQRERGVSSHADRVNPPAIQANVPMLGWGRPLEERFSGGIDAVRNRTSHFQLFPTMLMLMGFDEQDVTSRYGVPLWGPPPEQRVFLSGDIFGRGVVFINPFDDSFPDRAPGADPRASTPTEQ
jgi:glucan phosphoethanolaminetransferase (alkaline phosphatase superfamily)